MIHSKHFPLVAGGTFLLVCILSAVLWLCPSVREPVSSSGQPDYAPLFQSVMEVDIQIDPEKWQELLDNAMNEEYVSCDVCINGTSCPSVGIRAKGNSSLMQVVNSDSDRYSLKLEFDQYIPGQTFSGLDKLVLNNNISDPTSLKDYLSYELFDALDVPAPLHTFAHITVNGEEWGCYLALEALEESFANRNFGSDHGQLYKPETTGGMGGMGGNAGMVPPGKMNREAPQEAAENPDIPHIAEAQQPESRMMQKPENAENQFAENENPTPGKNNRMPGGFGKGKSSGGADLVYVDENADSYPAIFTSAVFDSTSADEKRVITALKHIQEGSELEKYVNVDALLRYIAVNAFVVNMDSYFSNMTHNYYLYEENGRLSMLPWDYNLAFGSFRGQDMTSAVNFPIDTPVSGITPEERPLIGKLLEVEEYRQRYHTYLQQLLREFIVNGHFDAVIDQTAAQIAPLLQKDPTAFYTFEEQQAAIPVLKQWAALRAESIQGQLDGRIPSTTEGQKANISALIDGSTVDASVLGSHEGFDKADRHRKTPPQENPFAEQIPSSDEMQQPAAEPVMENQPPMGNFPENPGSGMNLGQRMGFNGGFAKQPLQTQESASRNFFLYGAYLLLLAGGILWVARYKRK